MTTEQAKTIITTLNAIAAMLGGVLGAVLVLGLTISARI